MDAMGTLNVAPKKISWGFIKALESGIREWLLICLLFINAGLSYLITRFARHHKLQAPCPLCSRLDHVFGNEKAGYYFDLVCKNHKLEISSLVLCHAHTKLVDVHGMCESCLFSFATINKSNSETYRLLVGKLEEGPDIKLDLDPLLAHKLGCSCCKEPLTSRGYAHQLIRTDSIESGATEHDVPFPNYLSHTQDKLNKILDEPSASAEADNLKTRGFDHSSHIGCTELKVASDTESETLFCDNDDTCGIARETIVLKQAVGIQHLPTEPRIISLDDDSMASENLMDPTSVPEPLIPMSQVLLNNLHLLKLIDDPSASVEGNKLTNRGLDHLSHIEYTELKIASDAESEIIFSDDDDSRVIQETIVPKENLGVPCMLMEPRSITPDDDYMASEKFMDPTLPEPLIPTSQMQLDTIDLMDSTFDVSSGTIEHGLENINWKKVESIADPSVQQTELIALSSAAGETPDEKSKEAYVTRSEEVAVLSATDCEDNLKDDAAPITTTETGEKNPVSGDNGLQASNSLDLGDAYNLAVGNMSRQLSGGLAEQWIGKDCSGVSEDLKLFLAQKSFSRCLELSVNDITSPKLSLTSDQLKTSDTSSLYGMHILQKRISLERNESGLSVDGSIVSLVSEIEGESLVDRLKRQVDQDKKSMIALYRELEEERNASAEAANQAMAMITRLQEEKAALHMEALQYLRMMEEQSEYDMDALQRSNDLLAEKKKEIQDLEADLEFYRKRYPNESLLQNRTEPACDFKNTFTMENLLAEFEDERLYIIQSLKKLDDKLLLFSNDGVYSDLANRECSWNGEDGLNESKESSGEKENDAPASEGFSVDQGSDFSSSANPQFISKDNELNSGWQVLYKGNYLGSIRHEVHDLKGRLKALEADQNFLEHAINSLINVDKRTQFVQEIASYLRELRRIGTRRTD